MLCNSYGAIPEKIQTEGGQGREDMKFRGVLKKAFVEIPGGQLKKKQNFHGVFRKTSHENSHPRVLVFELGIYSKEYHLPHNFAEFPGVKACFHPWNFILKVTNLITPGQGFQKSISSTPIWIFSEIVHVVKLANFYHQER